MVRVQGRFAATAVDGRGPITYCGARVCPRTHRWTILGIRCLRKDERSPLSDRPCSSPHGGGVIRSRHLEAPTVQTMEHHFHGLIGMSRRRNLPSSAQWKRGVAIFWTGSVCGGDDSHRCEWERCIVSVLQNLGSSCGIKRVDE